MDERVGRSAPPPYGTIYNWDGNPFRYKEFPEQLDDLLKKVFAPIEDTPVGALFWCVGEHEAEWPSEKIPMAGESVGRVYETVWGMRHAESLRAMFERGEDPYDAIVRRGRDLGLGVWASVRMNDNHFWSISPTDGEVAHKGNPLYWMTSVRQPLSLSEMPGTVASGLTRDRRDHTEWCLGDAAAPWASTSWNMAIPEVREIRLQFISEAMNLADWDGIELDWQRHAVHLPQHDAHRLMYTMTDVQRAVRELSDRIAEERGRPLHVAVRVAATLEACRSIGYDIETWAQEGLCDVVIPSGTSGTDPGIEMGGFRKLLDGTGIQLYPCLDTDFRVKAARLEPHSQWSDSWRRGEAAKFWDQGADGIYLFNWHATRDSHRHLLESIGSPETLRNTDKVYAATHGFNVRRGPLRYGVAANDRIYAEPPVELHRTLTVEGPTFSVPMYDDNIDEAAQVSLMIELEHFSPQVDKVSVALDGQSLSDPVIWNVNQADPDHPASVHENSWLSWEIKQGIPKGVHQVDVRLINRDSRLRVPVVVSHVEIHISYPR